MIKSKEKLKPNQGITLIALVITIIVLLILAGVTIATLFGENGILTKATEASEETEIAQEKEEVRLAYTAAKANKENYEELVTDAEMNDELDKLNSTGTASGTGTLTVTFESGREYTINQETGEITGPEKTLTEEELKEKLQQVTGDAFIDENGNIFDTDIYETSIIDETSFSLDGDYYIGSSYKGSVIDGNLEYEIPLYLKQDEKIYKLTQIGAYTFWGDSFTNISIPDGVVVIQANAFYSCEKLKEITIPESVEDVGASSFRGCNGLINIRVDEKNQYFDSRNNCNAIIETNTNELLLGCINTTIPGNVTSIGNRCI